MSDDNWQCHIVRNHPQLFMRSYRGLPFAPGYPMCPDGWREIVARMVNRVARCTHGYPVHFALITHARGSLRVHWETTATIPRRIEHAIDEAIALAEARSQCSCATCGIAGRLHSVSGLLLPACQEHAIGAALPAQTEFENVYLIRLVSEDDTSTIGCREYDRERDAFIDVKLPLDHPSR
jgi:hypothetical protein